MDSNDKLVDYLVSRDYMESEKVEKAFRKVDRADFVDTEPYVDRPVRLEDNSTISAPHMVAIMLELLEPGGNVLEMGSGSGYMLALLLQICDQVTGVERIESLAEKSRRKVPEADVIPGYEVAEEKFDQIVFSFAITEEEVRKSMERTGTEIALAPVKENGRQVLKKFTADETTKHGYVRYVSKKEGLRNE